jgi:AraC-like DNA-binding protein
MNHNQKSEHLKFLTPPGFEGVKIMSVENSPRLWRAYHDNYGICTVLNTGLPKSSHACIRYRKEITKIGREWISCMQPGELHITEKTTDPGTFWVVHIEPSVLERIAVDLGLKHKPNFKRSALNVGFLFAAFIELHRSVEQNDGVLDQQTHFHNCLELLLRYNGEEFVPSPVAKTDPSRMAQVKEYLHVFYNENIGLEKLAREVNCSPYHLNRTFREFTGLPPHKYLLCLRIAHAEKMLLAGKSPVEVALDVGFYDESHLLRHFKKIIGVSPGRYQKLHDCDKRVYK